MLMHTAKIWLPTIILFLAGTPQSLLLANPPGLPIDLKVPCLEKEAKQEIHSPAVAENGRPAGRSGSSEAGTKPAVSLVFEFSLDSDAGVFSRITAKPGSGTGYSASMQALSEVWSFLLGNLGGNSGTLGLELIAELPVARASNLEFIPVMPTPVSSLSNTSEPIDESKDMRAVRELVNDSKDMREMRASWEKFWSRVDKPVCPPVQAESSCPYVRAQATRSSGREAPTGPSVLENLDKLEEARQLYDRADLEYYAGRVDSASRMYEAVQRLCPGSNLDRQASGRLSEVQAAKLRETTGGNAEEEDKMPIEWLPQGLRVHCRVRLGDLTMTFDAKQEGHGSLMFGYQSDTLLGAAIHGWEHSQTLLPLLAPKH